MPKKRKTLKRKTQKKKVKYYKLQLQDKKGKWKTPNKIGYWGDAINNKFPKWMGAFKHQRHRLIAGVPCKIKKFY